MQPNLAFDWDLKNSLPVEIFCAVLDLYGRKAQNKATTTTPIQFN